MSGSVGGFPDFPLYEATRAMFMADLTNDAPREAQAPYAFDRPEWPFAGHPDPVEVADRYGNFALLALLPFFIFALVEFLQFWREWKTPPQITPAEYAEGMRAGYEKGSIYRSHNRWVGGREHGHYHPPRNSDAASSATPPIHALAAASTADDALAACSANTSPSARCSSRIPQHEQPSLGSRTPQARAPRGLGRQKAALPIPPWPKTRKPNKHGPVAKMTHHDLPKNCVRLPQDARSHFRT